MTGLSLDRRIDRVAQHVVRARIFFDLWFYFEEQESRSKILRTMETYNEFFRFAPHSFLTSFIVYIFGAFEDRRDSINLNAIYRELSKSVRLTESEKAGLTENLAAARPIFHKVKILRDNAFAHKTMARTYDDVFVQAAVMPFELRDLTDIGLQIANQMLKLRGQQQQFFAEFPLGAARRMMSDLTKISQVGVV